MGNNFAEDLANSNIELSKSIAIHLQGNHYPPVPLGMISPCINAINACNEGDWERTIDLEGAAKWRGQDSAPAHAIVEGHHLHNWIKQGEE